MGSIGLYRAPGLSDLDFFTGEILPREQYTVHAHGTVSNVFYAAVETHSKPGEVWALIVKMDRTRAADCMNFIYKDMSEDMLPYFDEAPVKVLDALTPTSNENANTWRAACRTHHARRAWVRKNVTDGTTIRLPNALTFSDGVARDTFTLRRRNRRDIWVGADGVSVRLNRWRDMNFTLVPATT